MTALTDDIAEVFSYYGDWPEMMPESLQTVVAAARLVADAPEVWWCEVHQLPGAPVPIGECSFWMLPLADPDDDPSCRMVRRLLVDPGDDT